MEALPSILGADAPTTERLPLADDEVQTSLALLAHLYNYNHWLFSMVRPFVGERVCEVGCGTGNITQFLLNCREVVGLEPSRQAWQHVEQRFADHVNVRFLNCFLEETLGFALDPGHFDTIICMNVLEHIESDVTALKTMRRLCCRGGRVAIVVPAHMSIFGEIDRRLGHYCRYSKSSLRRLFETAGLTVVHSRYLNMPGYFGWGLFSRVLRRTQISVEGGRIMNALVPFIDVIERLVYVPFGQSLVMVGTPGRA